MKSIDSIFRQHNTDKNLSAHNYGRQYETLLNKYRSEPTKYLEIGVFNGGSIRAMREVFKNSDCIVGLDIDPRCKAHENVNDNIFVEIGDVTDPQFVKNVTQKYGTFDVILDDGSHINSQVINAFELLFPLLNDNGIYIVEDTVVYKYSQYNDTSYPNHLNYFIKYIPLVNQCRFDSEDGCIKDFVIDPYKIVKKTDNVFEYSIDKIEFGCSFIAIHKKIRHHWIP